MCTREFCGKRYFCHSLKKNEDTNGTSIPMKVLYITTIPCGRMSGSGANGCVDCQAVQSITDCFTIYSPLNALGDFGKPFCYDPSKEDVSGCVPVLSDDGLVVPDSFSLEKTAVYLKKCTLTNNDPRRSYFHTLAVEFVINFVRKVDPAIWALAKSTILVDYTAHQREEMGDKHIIVSPKLYAIGPRSLRQLVPARNCYGIVQGRRRGREALREPVPSTLRFLLQRARRLLRGEEVPKKKYHQGRLLGFACRRLLHQPTIRVRRILSAEGFQAVPRQLPRCPTESHRDHLNATCKGLCNRRGAAEEVQTREREYRETVRWYPLPYHEERERRLRRFLRLGRNKRIKARGVLVTAYASMTVDAEFFGSEEMHDLGRLKRKCGLIAASC
jgi:hypothetical protein